MATRLNLGDLFPAADLTGPVRVRLFTADPPPLQEVTAGVPTSNWVADPVDWHQGGETIVGWSIYDSRVPEDEDDDWADWIGDEDE